MTTTNNQSDATKNTKTVKTTKTGKKAKAAKAAKIAAKAESKSSEKSGQDVIKHARIVESKVVTFHDDKNMSFEEIAERFNKQGLTTVNGLSWTGPNVRLRYISVMKKAEGRLAKKAAKKAAKGVKEAKGTTSLKVVSNGHSNGPGRKPSVLRYVANFIREFDDRGIHIESIVRTSAGKVIVRHATSQTVEESVTV